MEKRGYISNYKCLFSTSRFQLLLNTIIFISLCLIVGVLYGFLPKLQVPSLGIWYYQWGSIECVGYQSFPNYLGCSDVLVPYGSPFLQGFIFTISSGLIVKFFGLSSPIAANLVCLMYVALTVVTFLFLMKRITGYLHVGYLCSILFFFNPFIYGHSGYGSMLAGFILMPISIFADYITTHFYKNKRAGYGLFSSFNFSYLFLLALFRFLISGTDWYTTIIAIFGGFAFLLFYSGISLINRDHMPVELLINFIAWSLTWFVGAFPWYIIMPVKKFPMMPMDFFRAAGVDLITLLFPTNLLLWAKTLGIGVTWPPLEYYGDGSNVNYNYIGWSTIIFVTLALVNIKKLRGLYTLIISFFAAAILCFMLSLGPSLKVNSHRCLENMDRSRTISSQNYLMPKDNVIISNLPTAFVYKLFPICNMRAVYRWLLYTKVVFILLVGVFIGFLTKYRTRTCTLIAVIIVLFEFFPRLTLAYKTHHKKYIAFLKFNHDVLVPLNKYMNIGDRVVFVSNENDYLASWLGPVLRVKTFNGGGDKNIQMAIKYFPNLIKEIKELEKYPKGRQKIHIVEEALKEGIVDKVVFPFFSLRWESYYWPPSEITTEYKAKKFDAIGFSVLDDFSVFRDRYFAIVSLR